VARARAAGAWGYAPKRLDDEELLRAIREVAAGRRWFPAVNP
jgi:DNA-binding NarL/FixJ family response regulator